MRQERLWQEQLAGTDTNKRTNYEGVLYDFTGTEGNTDSKEMTTNHGPTGYREPDVVSDTYDNNSEYLNIIKGILTNQTDKYENKDTFKTTLQEDYSEVIESVKTYGGFYVGRYEMGLEENGATKKAISKKGPGADTRIGQANTWYGLYAYGKTYENTKKTETSSVKSSMIWGSQYDAMLNYALLGDSKGKITATGNSNPDGFTTDTGATEDDKIINVYDLEGVHYEWILEAYGTSERTGRGGNYDEGIAPSNRDHESPSSRYRDLSTHITLYIN